MRRIASLGHTRVVQLEEATATFRPAGSRYSLAKNQPLPRSRDSEGNAMLHSDAEARHELGPFNDCYRKAVRARVERKRQAGQPVPEAFDRVPSADID